MVGRRAEAQYGKVLTLYELYSKLLEGGFYRGFYRGTTTVIIKGDTRSLESNSYPALSSPYSLKHWPQTLF